MDEDNPKIAFLKVTATKARATSQQPKATVVAASPKPPVAATRLPKNDENLEAAKKRLLSPEKRAYLADKRTRVHSPKVFLPLYFPNEVHISKVMFFKGFRSPRAKKRQGRRSQLETDDCDHAAEGRTDESVRREEA